jgi:hypothetical protein
MTSRQKINILITTTCFILFINPALALETFHLLDGKTFTGFNGEKGQDLDPNEAEEIVFNNGRFISTTCNKYNFSDVAYSASDVGDSIHFQAVTLSPTHGKIEWQGVVHGDQADVTFVWTKERWYWNTHREYWFKGSLKQ